MPSKTAARQYKSNDHLRALIETTAGSISVLPLRAHEIHFDAAWSNYRPTRQGMHGSTPLDLGRGVKARATGNVIRLDDGRWYVRHNSHSREDDRELTTNQAQRTLDIIAQAINEWAKTHEGDLAQADDIDRNNDALKLERAIAKHELALRILHEQLEACNEGETYRAYPELPTSH